MAGAFFRELVAATAGPFAGRRGWQRARADWPDAARARAGAGGGAARCGARCRRHELDARRRAGGGATRHPRRARRGRAARRSIGGCPRRRTGSWPITSRAGRSRRRRPLSRTSRAEGIADGVHLVGDVMQDLVARIAPEVRDGRARADAPARVDLGLGYLFATIHRAENREPEPSAAGLDAARRRRDARSGRSCSPLHPGTRAAVEALGLGAAGERGGRRARSAIASSIAAAAARGRRADRLGRRPARGGVARRAVPRPARDDRVGRDGRGVRRADGQVVGLDAAAASAALERLAPGPSRALTAAARAGIGPSRRGRRSGSRRSWSAG